MPASAMTFFQTSVSCAMWAAASTCVLARVSMPCWAYAAFTSGALRIGCAVKLFAARGSWSDYFFVFAR
jgi:hypothetical protein